MMLILPLFYIQLAITGAVSTKQKFTLEIALARTLSLNMAT